MTSIVRYRKVSTPYTIIQMQFPDAQGPDDSVFCVELCALGDLTYVAVPDSVVLPNQPAELVIEPVVMTAELREQIKAASPHCAFINERMEQKIRSVYSVSDEQYFARIGVGVALGVYEFGVGEQDALMAFGTYVEGVRQWGRDQRALLGL